MNKFINQILAKVRNDDPITSFQASDRLDFIGEHQDVIIVCLAKHGPLGKDGIASKTALDGNQVARRLKEMMTMDLIETTGQTVKSNAGRSEREWRLKVKQ